MARWLAGLLIALGCFASGAISDPHVAGRTDLLVRITSTDMKRDLTRLQRAGFDVAGVNHPEHIIDLTVSEANLESLDNLGISYEVMHDIRVEALSAGLDKYHDPHEAVQAFEAFAKAYPKLAKLEKIGESLLGFPMVALKISDNVAVQEDEPTVFYNAAHHAREVMTPEVVLDTAEYLLVNYGKDPKITKWVDSTEIWLTPHVNPDGAAAVFKGDTFWRKNRRTEGASIVGVDVNRNYPYQWGECNGSSNVPMSQTYRGKAPSSEPETQVFMKFVERIRPVFSISYHSYSELVLYPYGCNGKHTPEALALKDLGKSVASKLVRDSGTGTYIPGTPWETLYSVSGDDISWMYAQYGVFPFVIEVNATSQGFQPDYDRWRDATVKTLRPGWGALLDRLSGPLLTGHVTDAATKAPIAATLTVQGITYSGGETLPASTPKFGRYFRPLLPGKYTVTFSATGYTDKKVDVDVGEGNTLLDVSLEAKRPSLASAAATRARKIQ